MILPWKTIHGSQGHMKFFLTMSSLKSFYRAAPSLRESGSICSLNGVNKFPVTLKKNRIYELYRRSGMKLDFNPP